MTPHRLLTVAILLTAACVGDAADRADAGTDGLRGAVVNEPFPKPDFTLTDTNGDAFAFRAETDGFLTLIFFGYTYCPDICPVHMANLGAVIGQMPPTTAQRIKVIFVTTDPARDSPDRLRTWLDHFHGDFIGLAGPLDQLNEIQRSMGLPPAQLGEADSTGFYPVGHAAAVVAFTPDNLGRAFYPFGIRQTDWAHDLPMLLEYE